MEPKLIFLVGCPRSGTTWLQLLLGQHPAVATLHETHLFPDYLQGWVTRWQADAKRKRDAGLTAVISEDEFTSLCRDVAERVFRVALRDKPAARFILEKTPLHVHHAEQILQLFPDACFVHLVRDPRAVVASLLAVSRSWGSAWAPRNAERAAQTWCAAVAAGHQLASLTSRRVDVTYEQLKQSPEAELKRVLAAIGLPVEPGFCAAAVQACSAETLKQGNRSAWVPESMHKELDQAIRRGEVAGWRSELSRRQIHTVEYVTRESLLACGYTPSLKRSAFPPPTLLLARGMRVLGRAAQRMVRLLTRH